MISLLQVPSFALLWFGSVISRVGDRALRIALPFFVYEQTGSTVATALLALALYLPGLLFGSFAGVLVDRWDRRRILVISNVVQAFVILLLALAPRDGLLWVAYAVTFAELTISMLLAPAAGSILPSLVRADQLMRANAVMGLGSTAARLTGPLIGGALIGLFGLPSVVIFDSLSFLAAAAAFTLLPAVDKRDKVPAPSQGLVDVWRGMAREWREGIGQVLKRRSLVGLFVTMNVTSLGGCLVDPFFVPFVTTVLREGPETLGGLSITVALGTLVGGLVAGWFGPRFAQRSLVAYGTVAVGAMMVASYNQGSLETVMALMFLMGLPLVISNVAAETMIQTATPDEYRGRVYGALGTTNALVGVISVVAGGVLGQVFGIVGMLTAAGAITVLAGILGLILLPREGAGRIPSPAATPTHEGAAV